MSQCSKPSCFASSKVVLAYDYGARMCRLQDAGEETSPHLYALCSRCADSLRPPLGWVLEDLRTRHPALTGALDTRLDRPAGLMEEPQFPFGDADLPPESIQKGHWSDPSSWS